MNEEERCLDAARFQKIDEAFRRGDLQALRAAVERPALIPNDRLQDGIGSCLVYAIYHSPLAFIRQLLELGADPNAPADDGFPPLIAALSCSRAVAGGTARTDVEGVVQLLLRFGADPNQRGINDYTPLHMAVAERHSIAAYRLLEAGADPGLRTRIDACETPEQMAAGAGLADLSELLACKGQPVKRRLRHGLTVLLDIPGSGEEVRRHRSYTIRLVTWLNIIGATRLVNWTRPPDAVGACRVDDDGSTLITQIRVNRGQLISGLFYGVEGMRVGGLRRLEIAPQMAYGQRGVPGTIPPGAGITTEITILNAHVPERE
jgi:hypothetical protein